MPGSQDAVRLTAAAAAVGITVTLLVATVPALRFAYRNPQLHLVLETTSACVALLVAALLYGRFRRDRGQQELLLVVAMLLLALANLALAVAPSVVAGEGPVTTWAPLVVRLVGGLLFAVAALLGGRRHVGPRLARTQVAAIAAGVSLVLLVAVLLERNLPTLVDPELRPETSTLPRLDRNSVVVVAQLVNCVLYALAAVGFTRQAVLGDRFLAWLGAAAALSATARVNYALFPSIYSEYVYTGDLLRAAFYLALAVGGVRELQEYWRSQTQLAVEEERRRLARDLHDGAVQELGFIRAQAQRLVRQGPSAPISQQVLAAADRALDETRRAIVTLSAPLDEPLERTLQRAAAEVADRNDVDLDVEVRGRPLLDGDAREAVVRIVREAVGNAARHSGASVVRLRIDETHITVSDDGAGFDPAATKTSGFGLVSMRDRAAGIGAALDVDSEQGRGTTVTVVLP